MQQCARCETRISAAGEWVELRHHHEHMNFESRFCSPACASAYLSEGLDAT
ncbi:hypothetical protein [Halosegnis longus]|uniref:hypothetical protein n=1 Tax=Halosegnis longus TaxID=2216012 RepID=UPI00129DE4BF|nr:hypothetical protein [Halosegnis longus]